MATAVELPQLGNTVEECLITRWVKRKGDIVSPGDVVAEVETDKTTFEITAPVSGTVLETFFEEGALVPVFSKIFVIGEPGEALSAPAPPAAPLSPRARRFAAQHGLQVDSIAGSGPGGRVLERDVRRAHAASPKPSPAPPSLRATIARRMRESLASTAQYTMHSSAGAAGLLALRARLKSSGSADITINDLVTFCTIQALLDAPEINAEYVDGKIVKHTEVHLAFACDTPRGLIAPVIRNAHTLPIGELALRMKALATQALDGTIPAGDLSGATFTISNLGGLGIESFTPLINPPQVAILGVGAIHLKPVRGQGTVEFIDAIGLSLTCDHQVIDGAPGARFLRVVKEKIESVESICSI